MCEVQTKVVETMWSAGVSMHANRIPERTDGWNDTWGKHAGHWRIRFVDGSGRDLEIEYSQGSGHRVWGKRTPSLRWKGQFATKPQPGGKIDQIRRTVWSDEQVKKYADFPEPHPADVLHCLILDSSACEMSHSEWCDECGFDSDSIHKRDMWMSLVENGHKLRNLFGKYYTTLSEILSEY